MKLFIRVFATLFAVTTGIACNSTTKDASLTDSSISDKTGADWDKAWADKMVDEHNELLDKLQSAKSYIGDSALNKLIINTIPVVASHLSIAKNLQARLKIN